MAELALEDRLQPALLDRLSDEARSIVVVELRADRQRLAAHGVQVDAIDLALRPLGMRRFRPERDARAQPPEEALILHFVGPTDGAALKRVRAAAVAAEPEPVTVERIADVASRAIANLSLETAAQRVVSMRQLRESVLRDLSWLLSTTSFDTDRKLSAWPHVARSVFNYGLPSMAGLGASSVDADVAAARLRQAIETFEPRLSHVRVLPEMESEHMDHRALGFRVEAELWGQPTPQRLLLRTQIDIDSSEVTITDTETG